MRKTLFFSYILMFCIFSHSRIISGIPLFESEGDADKFYSCIGGEGIYLNVDCPSFALTGQVIKFDATSSKFIKKEFVEEENLCFENLLPIEHFSWQFIEKPAGSTAEFDSNDQRSLKPDFLADMQGTYIVRLHVFDDLLGIKDEDLTIEVKDVIAIPPSFTYILPPSALKATDSLDSCDDDARGKCNCDGGVADPQWVTVDRWDGPEDYKLVEGKVLWSGLSRMDNFTNHSDHNDFIFEVDIDPKYGNLLGEINKQNHDFYGKLTSGKMEIEWENNHYPDAFRPTPDDRVSVFGYHIYDCGHGEENSFCDGLDPTCDESFRTEIHPPVGVAVHRYRPVLIPNDESFNIMGTSTVGVNVYVPGVVTQVYFSRHSGGITTGVPTALHQPYAGGLSVTDRFLNAIIGPSDIKRIYEFNIYLPLNPREWIAEYLSDYVDLSYYPEVPLYAKVIDNTGNDEDAIISQQMEVDESKGIKVYYLKVKIDLTNFEGDTYVRTINAGWVYPNSDNWGLNKWKLKINSLEVIDDGDDNYVFGIFQNDGDWAFWINTNNTLKEWTNIIPLSDGNVHGYEDFDGIPWATDSETSHDLGPDILSFPDEVAGRSEGVFVHTSGYENDGVIDDNTGTIFETEYLPVYRSGSGPLTRSSHCDQDSLFPDVEGCCDYKLNYEITNMGRVLPLLSNNAEIFADKYKISAYCQADCLPPSIEIPDRKKYDWHYLGISVPLDSKPMPLNKVPMFSNTELEENTYCNISREDFKNIIESLKEKDPEKLKATMELLRDSTIKAIRSQYTDDEPTFIFDLKAALPKELWKEYFSDMECLEK